MVNTRNARDKGLLSRAASKSLKDGKFTRAVEIKRAAAPAAKTPASIKRTAASKSAPTHRATSAGTKIRVWWEPSDERDRTEFGGMYWPAVFVKKSFGGKIRVKYDNGEEDDVDVENISPSNLPIDFGKETSRLEVGEFCEVFNNSSTDPAAWLGRVSKVNKKTYTVDYPFHDSDQETVKDVHVRRARVWDEASKTWKYIMPFQKWEDGEISSPVELELCGLNELKKALENSEPSETTDEAKEEPKEEATEEPRSATKGKAAAKAAAASTPAKTDTLVAAEAPSPAPAAPAEPGTAAADGRVKRRRPKKTDEQRAANEARKKQKAKDEAVMAATATSYTFSAAPPGPVIPPAPAILAIPGIAPPQLAPFALPGFPSNLQALQGLLSQPGMLPLLQTLMAAQASAMAYPPFPAPLAGMPLPGIPAATAASVPAVVPVPPTSAAPVALTANPSDPPPPPPQLPIPPLPPPEEEEPEEVIPKGAMVPPRKARSAYILFSMEFRKSLSREMSFNEATRLAAAKWKEADEASKQKYEAAANVEREEYIKQQTQYMQYRKMIDCKKAEKAAKLTARYVAVQAHEVARRKQLEMNDAYLQACAASGVMPQPVPAVPGVYPTPAEPSTSDSEADRINQQLNKLDMEKARKHILKYYHEDAWYLLVDVWRRGSENLEQALTSAKTHVFSKLRADWRGFMIGIFGVETMSSMARREGDPEPKEEEEK